VIAVKGEVEEAYAINGHRGDDPFDACGADAFGEIGDALDDGGGAHCPIVAEEMASNRAKD